MLHDHSGHENPVLVIVGPSGSGKTTLNLRLTEDFPETFENSISCTSRPIRIGEKDGVHYFFVSSEEFDQMRINDEFVEYTNYVGCQYGTPRSEMERILNLGKVPVLEIDIKGFKQFQNAGYKTKGVFIKPADLETLRKRLIARGRDTEDSIKKRLDRASQEIPECMNHKFDYILENDDLEVAYDTLVDKLREWYPSMGNNK